MSDRVTKVRVLQQGAVELAHDTGYLLVGNEEAVCFWIDVRHRGHMVASSSSPTGAPTVYLSNDAHSGEFTVVEFPEYLGWRVHSGGGGKSIAIALVKGF